MPTTRTFSGVTVEILSRMKEFGRAEYGIVYDPPEAPISTATSQTPLGECVIEFAHDAERDRDYRPTSPTEAPSSTRRKWRRTKVRGRLSFTTARANG